MHLVFIVLFIFFLLLLVNSSSFLYYKLKVGTYFTNDSDRERVSLLFVVIFFFKFDRVA